MMRDQVKCRDCGRLVDAASPHAMGACPERAARAQRDETEQDRRSREEDDIIASWRRTYPGPVTPQQPTARPERPAQPVRERPGERGERI